MDYTEEEVKKAFKELWEQYPDFNYQTNKIIIGEKNEPSKSNRKFQKLSLKRGIFKSLKYENCEFVNDAFAGSIMKNIKLFDCIICGSGLTDCNFHKIEIKTSNVVNKTHSGNNFSLSSLVNCTLSNNTFDSSGFLHVLFQSCRFNKTVFQSCTLEGSKFLDCDINELNLSKSNVEFIEFLNCNCKRLSFPLYQFAYVIGMADLIREFEKNIFLQTTEKTINILEYKKILNNLLILYWDKGDFFPMCNINISLGNFDEARSNLLAGVSKAINELDFRTIKYFCILSKRYKILTENVRNKVLETIENHISTNNIPNELLNNYIANIGEIKTILEEAGPDNVALSLNIKTNISKNNPNGVKYVNSLCNEINEELSQNDYGQSGFNIQLSNHSPFEIIVQVIATAGSIATIAQLIWNIVESKKSKSNNDVCKDFVEVDKNVYEDYVETRVELYKEKLLKIRDYNSKRKINDYIEEITQHLKTDLRELYEKDIMFFRRKNKK